MSSIPTTVPAQSAQLIELATDALSNVVQGLPPNASTDDYQALLETVYIATHGLIMTARTDRELAVVKRISELVSGLYEA